MRVLVTGVAGFIGSHLSEHLADQGHDVWGIDNLSFSVRENLSSPSVRWKELDVLDMSQHMFDFFRPDVVIHLAAVSCSRHPNEALIWRNNLWATAHLLSVARNTHIVFASTCLADKPETGAYADSKRACEHIIRPERVSILRLANVYGSRQRDWGTEPSAMAAWRRAEKEGQPLRIDGNGLQTRDFIHVQDVVKAFELAATNADSIGRTLDICTGVQTPVIEAARLFEGEHVYQDRLPNDPSDTTQDPGPARETLGFEARIELSKEALV